MVEYIILVGVIAILSIGAFRFFGDALRCKIMGQGKTVSALEGEPSAAADDPCASGSSTPSPTATATGTTTAVPTADAPRVKRKTTTDGT